MKKSFLNIDKSKRVNMTTTETDKLPFKRWANGALTHIGRPSIHMGGLHIELAKFVFGDSWPDRETHFYIHESGGFGLQLAHYCDHGNHHYIPWLPAMVFDEYMWFGVQIPSFKYGTTREERVAFPKSHINYLGDFTMSLAGEGLKYTYLLICHPRTMLLQRYEILNSKTMQKVVVDFDESGMPARSTHTIPEKKALITGTYTITRDRRGNKCFQCEFHMWNSDKDRLLARKEFLSKIDDGEGVPIYTSCVVEDGPYDNPHTPARNLLMHELYEYDDVTGALVATVKPVSPDARYIQRNGQLIQISMVDFMNRFTDL